MTTPMGQSMSHPPHNNLTMVTSIITTYEAHPYAGIIPRMGQAAFTELKTSIEEQGQLQPISIYQGMVLDGRERARACFELNIEVKTAVFRGDDVAALHAVLGGNLVRRHLSDNQRAAIGAEFCQVMKKIRGPRNAVAADKRPFHGRKSNQIASGILNVGTDPIEKAGYILKRDKALFNRIKAGEVKIFSAYMDLHNREKVPLKGRAQPAEVPRPEPSYEANGSIPQTFDSYEIIHEFLRRVCTTGWQVSSQYREGLWWTCFHRKGVAPRASWRPADAVHDWKRSIVCAAMEVFKESK